MSETKKANISRLVWIWRGCEVADLERLEEAYRFYRKAEKDDDAIMCGCLRDAHEWLFAELSALFDEE